MCQFQSNPGSGVIDRKQGVGDNPVMLEVLLLNPPGAMRSCLAGWQDVFALANRSRQRAGLASLFRCPIGMVRAGAHRPGSATVAERPDLVLVPVLLGDYQRALENLALLERQRVWHQEGITLASACAGSFLLAAAGILDGRRATTHWSLAREFRQRFPRIQLDAGELLVEHPAGPGGRPGALVCGGGITAYIDVALSLIARCGGSALAENVARTLLWDPHRPRQALYADRPPPGIHGDEAILKAEAWIETRLSESVSLARWASAAGLETRTFERRFHTALGLAPGQWLRTRRLQLARELLMTSVRTWEEISLAAGYRDPGSLRQLFIREFGISPRECRQRAEPALKVVP